MNIDLLSGLIVVSVGLFFGTGAGLLTGYLLKTQKTDWREMTSRQILVNAGLVIACSVICTACFAWYAFLR